MLIEFEDATPRNNKIKNVTIIILVILFVASFGIFGIYCAKTYNNNITLNKIENKVQNEKEVITSTVSLEEKMNNIYNSESKIAYLTFDDGPSKNVTPQILDLLKKENIKATFFVLGTNVKKNPDIVKRAYEEGHYIANHGYTHKYEQIYSNVSNVLNEYNKTEKLIQEAIENEEYSSRLFRFPGGYAGESYIKVKTEAGKLLNKNNIFYIDWNSLTGDSSGSNTKEKILNSLKSTTRGKGNIVVLMHDINSLTYETLDEVISYLKAQGYIFESFYNIFK